MSLVAPPDAVELVGGVSERTDRLLPCEAVSSFWSCPMRHGRLWGRRDERPGLTPRPGALDDAAWVRPVAQFWVFSAQPWAVTPDILT
jgi:hypothetical protein